MFIDKIMLVTESAIDINDLLQRIRFTHSFYTPVKEEIKACDDLPNH